jgi:hypothetical protein
VEDAANPWYGTPILGRLVLWQIGSGMTFERAEAGVKTQETEERTVEVRRQESPRVSRLAVISEVCCSWAARYDLRPDVVLFA